MLYASSGVIASNGEDTGALLGQPLHLFGCAWSGSCVAISGGSFSRLFSNGWDTDALGGRPLRLFGCAWLGSVAVISDGSLCRLC